jgi:hypothetical protein
MGEAERTTDLLKFKGMFASIMVVAMAVSFRRCEVLIFRVPSPDFLFLHFRCAWDDNACALPQFIVHRG